MMYIGLEALLTALVVLSVTTPESTAFLVNDDGSATRRYAASQYYAIWTLPRVHTTVLRSTESTDSEQTESAALWSLDPESDVARSILQDELNLTDKQYKKAVKLCHLVVEWNEKINLVSRKDCNTATVMGRHVLPSMCINKLVASDNPFTDAKQAVDVGTGGGFPGLCLAILYPHVQFTLLDSVGKKLQAVDAMADALQLDNVRLYHGRAEEWLEATGRFDVATGRSVSAVPQFCAYMQHLLKDTTAKLCYWIGGDVDDEIMQETENDYALSGMLPSMQPPSDKRILVLPQSGVANLAAASNLVLSTTQTSNSSNSRKSATLLRPNKKTKGAWQKRSNSVPKQRGYDNFRRYSSTNNNNDNSNVGDDQSRSS